MYNTIGALAGLVTAGLISYIIFLRHQYKKRKSGNDEKIIHLYKILDKVSEEKTTYKDRAIKMEDAMEKGYGVKVRIEKTVVKTRFSKLEWVVLTAGLHKLLKDAKHIEDTKMYIKLNDKIQEFLHKMDERNPEEEIES